MLGLRHASCLAGGASLLTDQDSTWGPSPGAGNTEALLFLAVGAASAA